MTARADNPRRTRRAGLAALPVALALVLGACGGSSTPTPATTPVTTSTTGSTSTACTPGTSPATTGATLGAVPVYWLGNSKVRIWLFREFRTVPDTGGRIDSALTAMMSAQPDDPDLKTLWSPPSRLDVAQQGDAITVDVSRDAFANSNVGSEAAAQSIQQLVWTATAAAQSPGPVTILVDGAAYDAWGVVRLGQPTSRDPQARAPIWIDTPTEGATVAAGPVPVTGSANVFEGHVAIEVRTSGGAVVATTYATAAMGEFREFEVSVNLTPGSYVISAYSPDVSGGESPEGPRMFEVTRAVTVR